MADGLIVRVSTDVSRGGVSGVALYAVACVSADEAVRTVRALLPENWRAKGAIGPISAETIAQLGLNDGEARLL